MIHIRLLTALLTTAASALCAPAIELPDSTFRYSAEVNATVSSGANTPFWLVNNRFGLSSIEKNNGYVRASLFKDSRKEGRRLTWGAGVDLAVPWNFTSSFVVQQLYADLRYRNAELSVGSKEWTGGFNNLRLSSGDLLFSNNSRPIPQARLSLPDYVKVPFTNGWIGIKGYLAYGAFTDDSWQRHAAKNGARHTKHVLFHSKGGTLMVGDTQRFPLTFEAGLQMGAQFGGQSMFQGQVIDMPIGRRRRHPLVGTAQRLWQPHRRMGFPPQMGTGGVGLVGGTLLRALLRGPLDDVFRLHMARHASGRGGQPAQKPDSQRLRL